jgi:hypothetical protein
MVKLDAPREIADWLNGDDSGMVQRVTSRVWAIEKLAPRRVANRL